MMPKNPQVEGNGMNSICPKALLAIAVLLMTACSDAPKAAPAPTDATASVTAVSAKTAFWKMYKSAYSWANDLVPLKLESREVPGIKNDGGNAGMWSATFGSYSRHEAVVFSYAVAAHPPDIYKGLNVGHPMPWRGPSRDVMPFQTSDLVVDSDAAYKTASGQAQAWLQKHPDKQVSFLLGSNSTRFVTPVWYVLWGDNKSGYSVFVDAKSGTVAKPGK
jgi:hypothetical protein